MSIPQEQHYRLLTEFSERFTNGDSFENISVARRIATEISGVRVAPGTPEAKQLDEILEQSVVRAARFIAGEEAQKSSAPEAIFERLVTLYQKQPTLGVRTSTSMAEQAYSTPVPLAYLASTLVGVEANKSVYEPCGGNGSLLLDVSTSSAEVNEINPARVESLRAQGFHVTTHDATTYRPDRKFDVLLANPPFGSIRDESGRTKVFNVGPYLTTQIDHVIALNSLECMEDQGSAVLILGGKQGNDETRSNRYNTTQSRAFYKTLYERYKVVDHFSIDGDLYRRQGAGFPIDFIVIQGRGRSPLILPAASVPRTYQSFEQLKEVLYAPYLNQSRLDAIDLQRSNERASGSLPSQQLSLDPEQRRISDTAGRQGGAPDPTRRELEQSTTDNFALPEYPQQYDLSDSDEGTGGRESLGRGPDDTESSIAADDGRERNLVNVSNSDSPDRSGGLGNSSRNGPGEVDADLDVRDPSLSSVVERQTPYVPRSKGQPVNTLVPINMREAIAGAMEQLEQKVGDLDEYVAKKLGYENIRQLHQHFSAEQVDAVAIGIYNLDNGKGAILGDQTGIGKGRVVAAMLRYANQTGRIPVFVTYKASLYADMLRDLNDIGIKEFKPLVTDSSLALPLPDGREIRTNRKTHENELKLLIEADNLGSYDGIFTTYSQMQTVKGKDTLRREFLLHFAPEAFVVLDESHEAGGSVDNNARGKRKGRANELGDSGDGTENSDGAMNRADFTRALIQNSKGVFYSSATFAKDPNVMSLYFKTDMKLAVEEDLDKLVSLVHRGGVPLQQTLATSLAQAGQYIRRERSFDGITFDAVVTPVNHDVAERISTAMRAVLDFDRSKQKSIKGIDRALKEEGEALGRDASIGQAGASSTNFTSVMHNLISQSLLSLKAEAAVQAALSDLRTKDPVTGRSQKPLLAVSNTMGSFIGNYAQENNLKPGDPIALDLGDLLLRYLERGRDVMVKDAYGQITRRSLTDAELGPLGVIAYEQARQTILEADFTNIPISPIDYIKGRLQDEGYRVGEITGRKDAIRYGEEGPTYQRRSSDETSKASGVAQVAAFNRGDLDCVILNRSGSTGISLHASEKFQDQSVRIMTVVQAEPAINQFMQMLGRVNRTGQTVKPKYRLLMGDIPAEKRPGAVLMKKMASLSANTNAARSSGIDLEGVTDFFNAYGDQVVAELMENYPSLHQSLDCPLHISMETDDLLSENAIAKVTGRIPLLPIKQQEAVYRMIETEYKEYVAQQEAMGSSSLEAKTVNLDARTIARAEVIPGDPGEDSPFAAPVYIEVVDAKTSRNPYTTLQVQNAVRESLGLPPTTEIEEGINPYAVHGEAEALKTIATLADKVANYREAYLAELLEQGKPIEIEDENYKKINEERAASANKAVEKFDLRIHNQLDHVSKTLETFSIGTPIRALKSDNTPFYGVVKRISNVREEGKTNPVVSSPVVPSHWKMTLLLADSAREITVPFSKINTISENSLLLQVSGIDSWTKKTVYSRFDELQGSNREVRQIFTGNILRAYSKFKGQVINYTDNHGNIHPGLLTKTGFDVTQEIEKMPVLMPTAEDALNFLTEKTGYIGKLQTNDDSLTITTGARNEFILQTSKSKNIGGRFFLNKNLLEAAEGEFVSVSNTMQLKVDRENILPTLRVLLKNEPLVTVEHLEKAREMLSIKLPELEVIEPEKDLESNIADMQELIFQELELDAQVERPEILSIEESELEDNKTSNELRDSDFLPPIVQSEHRQNIPEVLHLSSPEAELPEVKRPPTTTPIRVFQQMVGRIAPEVDALLSTSLPEGEDKEPSVSIENLRHWYRAARAMNKSEVYLNRITHVAGEFKESGKISDKAEKYMQSDISKYEDGLTPVVQSAQRLLKHHGNVIPGNKRLYSGKLYAIEGNYQTFTVRAHDRGTVLSVANGQIQTSTIGPHDLSRFKNMSRWLDQQQRQSANKKLYNVER